MGVEFIPYLTALRRSDIGWFHAMTGMTGMVVRLDQGKQDIYVAQGVFGRKITKHTFFEGTIPSFYHSESDGLRVV